MQGMDNYQLGPSLNINEDQLNEDFTFETWPFDFFYQQNLHVYKTKQNVGNNEEEEDDDDEMKTILNLDDSTQKDYPEKDFNMETVDLSDLTFPTSDFMLDDCKCFEEASQLVDPTIKDSESTPFNFNNSDSVQLFRFSVSDNTKISLSDRTKISLSSLVRLSDNILNKNSEKCKMLCESNLKSDHCNVYHVLEIVENSIKDSVDSKKKSIEYNDNKSVQVQREKRLTGTIKRGRRYLPNFKQKVLEYAKNHSFKETALHFKINSNTITEWSRERKRLLVQNKKTSKPGSDCQNYKTDFNGTSESKTEVIFLNDIHFETETTRKNIDEDLPSPNMKPDERFVKWIETKRLQKKQLTREEVHYTAIYCLRESPPNEKEKPVWFIRYTKRFSQVLTNSITNLQPEKYVKYPVSFKLEVALYAREYTKNSASRVFNVPRKRVFDWFNCLKPFKDAFDPNGNENTCDIVDMNAEKEKLRKNSKEKVKHKIYLELQHWCRKEFPNNSRPSSYEIKEKAKEIFTSHRITSMKFSDCWLQKFCQRYDIKLKNSQDDRLLLWILAQLDNNVSLSHQDVTEKSSSLIWKSNFKGSKGWTLRFLKRHRNFLQNLPTVQDELPDIVSEKLNCFWNGFKQSLVTFQVNPGNVGCMDEIPLSFNYPEEGKTENRPLLRKTGFENSQGVVLLSALACGRLLPPAVVFKGSGPLQLLSDRNVEILILYQEKGVISDDILEAWFNNIWLSCVETPNALVVDSFDPHRTPHFKQLSSKQKCLLHIIPEGCSSRFQPLDVEVTRIFKEAIKKQWKEFSESFNSKLVRRYRCPDQDTILKWVQNAYEKINRNSISIINSFKTTGLLQ